MNMSSFVNLPRVLELARKHGVRTLTNAAPASRNLDPKIFELTDILCVNETEAEIITGRLKFSNVLKVMMSHFFKLYFIELNVSS